MGVGIHNEEGYTSYQGDKDYHLSSSTGVSKIRVDDAENREGYHTEYPRIMVEGITADNKKKILSALAEAEIPLMQDRRGDTNIAHTAKEIAAFRLGLWAEKNLSEMVVKEAGKYDNKHSLKIGDDTISIDKNIEVAHKAFYTDIPKREYRHEAIKLGKESDYSNGKSHVAVDIANKVVTKLPENNDEQRAFKTALQTAILEKAQAKYAVLLAEAQKELESGKALLAPIHALEKAKLITTEQADTIIHNELDVGRAKLSGLYEISTFTMDADRIAARSYKNLEAKDIVDLNVEMPDLDISFSLLLADKPVPQVTIMVPSQKAEAYNTVLTTLANPYRRPDYGNDGVATGKYWSNHSIEKRKGNTTIQIEDVPFDEAIKALKDAKLFPKAIADAIDRELKDLRAQAQKEVIDKLPPDTSVSDAAGMGKAKQVAKGAEKQ